MNIQLSNNIIDLVNKYYNTDTKIQTRKSEVKEPRQIAMKLLRESNNRFERQIPLQTIAKMFNLKQHGTVLAAIKRIDELSVYDNKLRNDIEFLENEVKKIKLLCF
jgi:chromosomal replication initiation ATPase DnaA